MAFEDFVSPIPFHTYVVTSDYGMRQLKGRPRRFHDALDIGVWASLSEPIPLVAIADGTVTVGRNRTSGQFISLKFKTPRDGIHRAYYCHLVYDSPKYVAGLEEKKRIQVKKGQILGLMGDTGSASRRRNASGGRHVHFMLFDSQGKHKNPGEFILSTGTVIRKRTFKEEDKVPPTSIKRNVFKAKNIDPESGVKDAVIAKAKEAVEKNNLELIEGGNLEELEEITDEELKASAIGFYLPRILRERESSRSATDSGIIRLRTKKSTPYAHNLIFSKIEQRKYPQFSLLTTNEISNLVPFAEIYIIKKLGKNREDHILFPFDDYSEKVKIDNIFYDKTGRGGNIGLKSVDWKTIGTNQSNVSQVKVSIKILIQDIQDIETKRNGISLLDLLYPAGTRDTDRLDDINFNIKLKLGWIYKMNPSLMGLEDKISEKLLDEVIFVSLFKHEFDFSETGTVMLNLEYIGMLESKLSNPFKYDILDKIAPEKKQTQVKLNYAKALNGLVDKLKDEKNENRKKEIKQRIKNLINEAGIEGLTVEGNTVIYQKENILTDEEKMEIVKSTYRTQGLAAVGGGPSGMGAWGMGVPIKVPDKETIRRKQDLDDEKGLLDDFASFLGITPLNAGQTALEQTQKELANSYVTSLQNLLVHLSKNDSIRYLTIEKDEVDKIKELSTIDTSIITKASFEKYLEVYSKQNIIERDDKKEEEVKVKSAFTRNKVVKYEDDKITIDKEKILSVIVGEDKKQQMVIPYTFLGEIVSYYSNYLFAKKNALENKDIRIVLGDFNYTNLGDNEQELQRAEQGKPEPLKIFSQSNISKELHKKGNHFSSLADVPISIDSLISWYNENVADPGLERLSFHSFLRSIILNLIPANLTNQVIDIGIGLSRNIISSFNYLTVKEERKLEKEIKQSFSTTGSYIEIPFNEKQAKNSMFYKLKSRANFPEVRNIPTQNYLFILPTNQGNYSSLKGEYSPDKSKDIFHFYVGEDKGVVKNIKFVREDNPGLDAANILKANQGDSHLGIIRRIYQGEIGLFGNTIFTPGQLVFIAPTYPGSRLRSKTLQRVGLGGYYRIIEIESYIEDGKFETKLKTKWQAHGDGTEKENQTIEVVNESEENPITEEDFKEVQNEKDSAGGSAGGFADKVNKT